MRKEQVSKPQEKNEVRILARRIAKKLTESEIKVISGGACRFGSTPSATVHGDRDDNPGMICSI